MRKILALLTAFFIAAGTLPFTIGAEGEAATVVSSASLDTGKIYSGSISDSDVRFSGGYARVENPTKYDFTLAKSNIAKKDMTGYLLTAAEKEAATEFTDAVVTFYIRCSAASKLDARFYHYISSSAANSTDRIAFSVPEESAGKWINISIPLKDFTVSVNSKSHTFSQFIVSNKGDNSLNKTIEVTPAVIYSNSTYTKYADPEGIEIEKTLSLNMYEKAALSPALTAPDGYSLADETVTYTSDNELVAAVDNGGAVFACGAGSAVITAEAANGLTAECRVTVAKTETPAAIATYSRKADETESPVFTTVYDIVKAASTTGKDVTIQIFGNGSNANNSHYDLSAYIGKTQIESQAMVAFYIKASDAVELKAQFFKSSGSGTGKYKATSIAQFSVTNANEWQLVKIPLSEFTFGYEVAAFSRFDIIVPKSFAASENPQITISAVKVYSADPYCAVISDNAELTTELPYYTEGQTVRFSAVPGADRIPNIESFSLETSEGALESAVTPVENSELFSFVMPSGAVRISAEFTDKSVRNIAAYMLYGTTESGKTTLVSRVYIPLEAQSVLYGGSEYTVSDIGLAVVPRDLLFADETPEESEFKKEISVLDGGDIRGYERTGGADCTVIINNVKNEREYVCRTYIRLKSETGEKTVYGNIFVK